MAMYAIFTWDSEHGPIKSWDRMCSVEMHNGRTKPIAHGIEGAPSPEFLVGSPAIVKEVRQRLVDHRIDPGGIRNGGVIAHEAVITASREFFVMGTPAEQRQRLDNWKREQVVFVTQRYGVHRVVSMVLHQDEHTPHIHAVVVPLKHGVDGRRRTQEPRWGLDNQVLTARNELRQLQTDYGKAMAHLGLSRGRENSERKHQPYSVALSDLTAEREALRLKDAEVTARERELDTCFIRLRDGWLAVQEKDREAAAARSLVAKMLEELRCREIDYEGLLVREGRLNQSLTALREREKAVAAREDALDRRGQHRNINALASQRASSVSQRSI